jgi:hypothetical protein
MGERVTSACLICCRLVAWYRCCAKGLGRLSKVKHPRTCKGTCRMLQSVAGSVMIVTDRQMGF